MANPGGSPPRGQILRSTPVGTVPGTAAVDQNGNFSYSIPIEVPPGVSGAQPSLALTYGGTAHGNVGVGMQLSGLSSITRCPRTLGRDGHHRPISWNQADALCLDGERLIANIGANGQHGTEYRPTASPLVRVVAAGASDAAGSRFIVHNPDGTRLEYGEQDPSGGPGAATVLGRPGANRLVPLVWSLRRSTDRFGNEVEYEYAKTHGVAVGDLDSDQRLVAIHYGRNQAAGTSHTRTVRFEYLDVVERYFQNGSFDKEPRVQFGFVAGQRTEHRYLLEGVATEVHGGLVHRYRVTYEPVPADRDGSRGEARFFARSVTMCDAGNVCLPETTFTWSWGPSTAVTHSLDGFAFDGVPFYPQPPVSALASADPPSYERAAAQVMGDFDADGDLDMLVSPEPINPADGIHLAFWQLWLMQSEVHAPIQTNALGIWNKVSTATSPVGASLPEATKKNYALKPTLDEKAQPMAFAINYDGTHGTDVLVGVPAQHLAGAFMDPPWGLGRYTYRDRGSNLVAPEYGKPRRHEADFEGHPGIMSGLEVMSLVPGSTSELEVKSLGYQDARPILWAYPLDLNGDQLTDIMFCQANESYLPTADLPVHPESGAGTKWLEGQVRYAINTPGSGIDLSNGGLPLAQPSSDAYWERCHFNDYVYVNDVYGDGREQLLRVRFIEQPWPTPADSGAYFGQSEKDYFTDLFGASVHNDFDQVANPTYKAHVFDDQTGTIKIADTGLPFDRFLRWRFRAGNTVKRYSGLRPGVAGQLDAPTEWDIKKTALTSFLTQPVAGRGLGDGRWGDFNGDGLVDLAIVDFSRSCAKAYCSSLTEDFQCASWEEAAKACTLEDVVWWAKNPIEASYESIGVTVYWNTGNGFRQGGSFDDDLWNGEIYDPAKARREWRTEWASSIVTDLNKDGISDLFYFNADLVENQPYLSCNTIQSCPEHAGDVLFRMAPSAIFGSHSGAGHPRAHIGVDINALVEDLDIDDDISVWGIDLKHVPGAKIDDEQLPYYLYDSLVNAESEDQFSLVTKYEAHQYGFQARTVFTDVTQDGIDDVMIFDHMHGRWELGYGHTLDEETPMVLTGITNGLGARTEVAYAPQRERLQDYLPASLPYPLKGTWSNSLVVSEIREDSGLDDGDKPLFNTTSYYYENPLADVRRGINVGPRRRWISTAVPTDEGLVRTLIVETYDNQTPFDPTLQVYPLAGALVSRLVQTWRGVEPAQVVHEGHRYSARVGVVSGTWQRQVDASYTASYELPFLSDPGLWCLVDAVDAATECDLGNGAAYDPMATTQTVYTYNAFGNVEYEQTTGAGQTSFTRRTFQNDTTLATYAIGLVKSEITGHEPTQGAGFTIRRTDYDYDAKHALEWVRAEPIRPQYRSSTRLGRDAFGHVTEVRRFGDLDPLGMQFTTTTYDPDGVFPVLQTNAKGHTTSQAWFAGCGVPERTTDPANRSLVHDIDGFCRPRGAGSFHGAFPLAPKQTTDYAEWEPDAVEAYPDVEVKITNAVEGGASSFQVVDRLGRGFRSQAPSFGFDTWSTVEYDRLGRPHRQSLPAKLGEEPAGWRITAYDGAGRVTKTTRPDGTEVAVARDRYQTTVTNELGHTSTSWTNAAGQVVRVEPPVDPNVPKVDLCYGYGAFGTMTSAGPCVPTLARSTTQFRYDDYGRRTQVIDGQLGTRTTAYDPFGRVDRIVDAKGQTTKLGYDVLDRTTGRTQDFGTPNAKTATWVYDAGAPPGELAYSLNAEGTVRVRTLYDEHARPRGAETTIHGRVFTSTSTYDARGHVETVTYPSPVAGQGLVIRNTYTTLDQLREIWHDGAQKILWQPFEVDVLGNTIRQWYGNGVEARAEFDPLSGALQWSKAIAPNASTLQHFAYDWYDDGRLKQRQRVAQAPQPTQTESFTYDARGQLATWATSNGGAPQLEAMLYDGVGNILSSPTGTFAYAGERLDTVASGLGLIDYNYDANGNVVTRSVGPNTTKLSYDSLDRLSTIGGTGENIEFTYSADGTKVHALDLEKGHETYYVGDYQEFHTDETIVARHNVAGVAHIVRTWKSNEFVEDIRFVQPGDHLGSTTLVTDANGAISDERSHDPWGAPRDPHDWLAPALGQLPPDAHNVGFAGHEGRTFGPGLVDMKARWYDPAIGRFLQADTVVPSPFTPLDWNRYTYVRNAPTVFTDPTGHYLSCIPGSPSCASEIAREMGITDGVMPGYLIVNAIALGLSTGRLGEMGAMLRSLATISQTMESMSNTHAMPPGMAWRGGKLQMRVGVATTTKMRGVPGMLRGSESSNGGSYWVDVPGELMPQATAQINAYREFLGGWGGIARRIETQLINRDYASMCATPGACADSFNAGTEYEGFRDRWRAHSGDLSKVQEAYDRAAARDRAEIGPVSQMVLTGGIGLINGNLARGFVGMFEGPAPGLGHLIHGAGGQIGGRRYNGQSGSGGDCKSQSCRIARDANLPEDAAADGVGAFPVDEAFPDLPIPHVAVRNPDETITDVTLLGNLVAHTGRRTTAPSVMALPRSLRGLGRAIRRSDTFTVTEYENLVQHFKNAPVRPAPPAPTPARGPEDPDFF